MRVAHATWHGQDAVAVTVGKQADCADSDGLPDGGRGMPATGLRSGASPHCAYPTMYREWLIAITLRILYFVLCLTTQSRGPARIPRGMLPSTAD